MLLFFNVHFKKLHMVSDESTLPIILAAREAPARHLYEASRNSLGYKGVWSIPTTFLQFDFLKFY